MKPNISNMKIIVLFFLFAICNFCFSQNYTIVDTGVKEFYNNSDKISVPLIGDAYYGQDANYNGNQPSYTDNGDGTISDNVTGLMWQKEMGSKISYVNAFNKTDTMTLGGYNDWRVPTIKELYSLILFTGQVANTQVIRKFIDTNYFPQPIGDITIDEREIDAQTWSSTQYVGLTMIDDTTVFGVNFLDGRIKGYPKYQVLAGMIPISMYFRMVRGNPQYGINNFVVDDKGTITDNATGLMWQQADDGIMRDWENALSYAENLTLAGYSDWQLPNAKELQSIVDYSRSPETSNSPAINPIFSTTQILDPDGNSGQYPYFWTGTTHLDGANPYSGAVYIAFGKAQGKMNGILMDVHGAGSQRSDPKSGNASNFPDFHGPQGDVRYVYNAVRCVRDVRSINSIHNEEIYDKLKVDIYPNPIDDKVTIHFETISDFVHIEICDNLGKSVYKKQCEMKDNIELDLNGYSKGIYFIIITTNIGTLTRKLMIQ